MSSSSSRNTTSTANYTSQSTINTVDNREVGDNAVVGGNVSVNTGEASQVSVTTTDQGAVKAGLDIALESLNTITSATNRVLDASSANTRSVLDSTNSTISQAYGLANQARQSETSGAINNFLKYAAIIAGIAIAGWVLVKAKG